MSRSSTSSFETVVIGFFLLLIVATGLVDTLAPVAAPKLFGDERRLDARMRRDTRWHDGSRARLVEHELRLTSRVRRVAGSYYAYALYRFLGEAQGRLWVGSDHWLFIPARASMPPRDHRALARHSAALLAAADRRLATLGIRLVLLPVPRKSVVYQEYLPPRIDPWPLLDDVVTSQLLSRGVETVDLLEAFRAHRESRPEEHLYFQADSHWTDRAQLIAARETCRTVGLLVPAKERTSRLVSRGLQAAPSDQLRYIGLHVPQPVLDRLGLAEVESIDVVDRREGAGPASTGRFTLAGTSFSKPRKLADYLEHFCGRPFLNAARPGVNPVEGLTSLLTRQPLPELLVFEIPNHNVIGRHPLFGIGDFFASVPIPEHVPRFLVRELDMHTEAFEEMMIRGRREVASLTQATLSHSGDGILSLRLRGQVRGAAVRVLVEHAGTAMKAVWPKDRDEIFLPLVSGRPTAEGLRVALEGRGKARIDTVDLITALDRTRAVAARHAKATARPHGWAQSFPFRGRPRIARHSGLLVNLDVAGAEANLASGDTEVVVVTDGGRRSVHQLGALEKQSQVWTSLSFLYGERLVAVELHGTGARPRRVARRVLYLPPGR